jgi:hypothetical protein
VFFGYWKVVGLFINEAGGCVDSPHDLSNELSAGETTTCTGEEEDEQEESDDESDWGELREVCLAMTSATPEGPSGVMRDSCCRVLEAFQSATGVTMGISLSVVEPIMRLFALSTIRFHEALVASQGGSFEQQVAEAWAAVFEEGE